MKLPPEDALRSLENRVQESLRTRDTSHLDILGYGEVTTVFRLETGDIRCACKRFPLIANPADADAHIALVNTYIDTLAERGVRCIETDFARLRDKRGNTILYLVQPIIEASRLGPNRLREATDEEALHMFREIVEALEQSVTTDCAPDGQLSNWAFYDDGLRYLDVSTPFMRDAQGNEAVNWDMLYETVLGGILRPLRAYFRRQLPEILDSYFSLRGQLLDFFGNLRKENLDQFLPVFIPYANEHCGFDEPITMDDVKQYYNDDADTYALLMRLYRMNRLFHRFVLFRPYPNFIPPHIPRNKFQES